METELYEYFITIDTGLPEVGIVNITVEAVNETDAKKEALLKVRQKYMSEYDVHNKNALQAQSRLKTLMNRAMKKR